MEENKRGLSFKAKIAIVVAVVVVIAVLTFSLISFMPVPMKIQWSKVQKIESNVALLSPGEGGNQTDAPALVKLNEDGSIDPTPWKILQFTDMHLTHELETTNETIDLFIDALNREKPDFVVLTGDIITRKGGRSRAKQLCEIFEKMGIYWGYVLGNHEGDSYVAVSRKSLIELVSSYPHCLDVSTVQKTASGESVWGNGNFVVNLLGENYSLSQSLIFMDSGNRISKADAKKYGVSQSSYDYLKDSQKIWYKEQVEKAIAQNAKTMLFIHIPLVEQGYLKFLRFGTPIEEGWSFLPGTELEVNGVLKGSFAIKDGWKALPGTVNYEESCSSDHNNGMYELMKSLKKGVNGLFCGHDHVNNSVIYEEAFAGNKPIFLCYGTCSGVQGYNLYRYGYSLSDDYALRGYSVIEINEKKNFDYYSVRFNNIGERIPLVIDSEAYAG